MLNDELAVVIETVWSEVLRATVRRLESEEPSSVRPVSVTARIRVSGPSPHLIYLCCSEPLARKLAAFMFKVDAGEASDADVSDAVGEMVNMVGGNVKCVFEGPSVLSLPEVELGGPCGGPAWSFPGAIGEVRFDDGGEPLLLAVAAPS